MATDPYRDGVASADERARLDAERAAREREAALRANPRVPPAETPTGLDTRPTDVRYAEEHGSPGHYESDDPDQLQDEIEVLQNRMAERLDRVTSAFTPQNLIAQVTGERNPDLFTTIDTVADAARRNPLAAGLIGVGLASLLMNRSSEPEPRPVAPPRGEYGVEGMSADGRLFAASGSEYVDDPQRVETRDPYRDPLHDPLDPRDPYAEPQTMEGMERSVRSLQDRAAARLSAATDALAGVYRGGRTRAQSAYDRTRGTFVRTERPDGTVEPGAIDWVRENPVPIGLAALAAGALAAGYYTASRPEPRRAPLPRDRSLALRDDLVSVEDEYIERTEPAPAPLPVSAAAPTPMGSELNRTAPVGGSGQIGGSPGTNATVTPSGSPSTGGSSKPNRTDEAGTAESIVRKPGRAPEGAGFGSTAASRGEVESKPSDGYQPAPGRSGASKTSASSTSTSSTSASSASSTSASSTTAGSDEAKASPTTIGADRREYRNSAPEAVAKTTDSSASRMTSDESDPDALGRADDDPSTSTEDLTRIYRAER